VGGVLFRCVDVGVGEIVGNRDVFDPTCVSVEDVAGGAVDRRIDEEADKFVADEEWMAVLAIVLWCNGPQVAFERAVKRLAEKGERRRGERRAVDGGNHRGVCSVIEGCAQGNLQGAELTAAGIGIADKIGAASANDGTDGVGIAAGNNNDGPGVGLKGKDAGGKQCVAGRIGAGCGRRPREHCLVGSHARRVTGREDYAAESIGVLHGDKIAPEGAREQARRDEGIGTRR
jgi:hypothetical protein